MVLNELYSHRRSGNSSQSVVRRNDFQRDYDRIIFSSAFRRLQNKTQVFPLPGSVFVHNRLTHSLEVSTVGRSLGSLAGELLVQKFEAQLTQNSKEFYLHQLSEVIAAACLCHDVGNPAFGHSGEDAIASYFERNASELSALFTPQKWADLVNFEGNANAIRVLTHQQSGKDYGGTQLTFTTLAAIAKYPCSSLGKDKKFVHRKKFGFFETEQEVFTQMANETHMNQESSDPLIYERHPFVWLVEAADDICYNIIDMEDAHRLKIVPTSSVEELFFELIRSENADTSRVDEKLKWISNANERISYLRAKVINALINKAIEVFRTDMDLIIEGKLSKGLVDTFRKESAALGEIESFSIQEIYGHRSVVEIENAGYNVMYELLDHFIPPILKEKKDRKSYETKAVDLLPSQFLYEEDGLYKRVRGVLDFISGMTDNYATDLYRKIKGIEIGMSV